MNVKESCDVKCESLSLLEVTVDNVVQVLIKNEEEVAKFNEKKQTLDLELESKKRYMQELELEKAEIDAQLTRMKLRHIAYQKEHTSLRNAITVVKFQIEKIKESIEKAKAKELEDLEHFEKSVDEITEKFRRGQEIYDRRALLEKIKEEKEKKENLTKKINELNESYLEFLKEKGLRARKNEEEKLIDCVLPDSELFCIKEMTNTLDEVIYEIKKVITKTKGN